MGVDLLDFYRGTLSARRLDVLIRHLPADSAFIRKASPITAHTAWRPGDYVVADLIDVYVQAHTPQGRTAATYPRPQQRIERWREQQSRWLALEQQAERNRLRELAEKGGDT